VYVISILPKVIVSVNRCDTAPPQTSAIQNLFPPQPMYTKHQSEPIQNQVESFNKEQSLERYRMKRLRRVFNRVRYSLRKQVSESRPRVKGRFIKTPPQDNNNSTPTSPSREVGGMMDNMSLQTLPKPGPKNSVTINLPQELEQTPPSTTSTEIVLDQVTSTSSDEIPSRKRKSSFFRISPRRLMMSFGIPSSGNGQHGDTPPLSGTSQSQLQQQRRRFSFSRYQGPNYSSNQGSTHS